MAPWKAERDSRDLSAMEAVETLGAAAGLAVLVEYCTDIVKTFLSPSLICSEMNEGS